MSARLLKPHDPRTKAELDEPRGLLSVLYFDWLREVHQEISNPQSSFVLGSCSDRSSPSMLAAQGLVTSLTTRRHAERGLQLCSLRACGNKIATGILLAPADGSVFMRCW